LLETGSCPYREKKIKYVVFLQKPLSINKNDRINIKIATEESTL
jgi:hypothetical protein